MYVRQFRAILSVVTHLFGTSHLICSRTHPPLLFSGLGPLFLLFILLFSRPILLNLTRGAWCLYFVVLARNCVASTLDYIVVHMRKTNRGKGHSIKTDPCLLSLGFNNFLTQKSRCISDPLGIYPNDPSRISLVRSA